MATFTVTLHYDLAPNLAPTEVRRCATYREAYDWARGAARSQAFRGDEYVTVVFDKDTWLDTWEARRPSHNILVADRVLAHAVITCDDLAAWHATLEAGADKWE